MPWTLRNAVIVPKSLAARYSSFTLPVVAGVIGWGFSASSEGEGVLPRRRNCFMTPFIGIGGRQYFGPSEEVYIGINLQPVGIHAVRYGWLDDYPGMRDNVSGFGVAYTGDRGSEPFTASLWSFSP